MKLSQALNSISLSSQQDFSALSDILSPELIEQCLQETGNCSIRKRRLPNELMIWTVIGMALFRGLPMNQIVQQMDIMLPGNKPFVAPSAVVQARQRLGSEAVKMVFERTQKLWDEKTPHPDWHGLKLLSVDGVVFRTPDSPENDEVFGRSANADRKSLYPQVRMLCHMELTSHLILNAVFDSYSKGEQTLAPQLIKKTPDCSLTILDRGFYSFPLLYDWLNSGEERHWILRVRKDMRYNVIKRLGKQDQLVEIFLSPQMRKLRPDLPDTMTVRRITRKVKNKDVYILTSLLDSDKYCASDIVELYTYRWEIELGYREMKQYLLRKEITLRSKKPDMIKQELWGTLLAYNLIRFQMCRMAYSLKNIYPYQLSFNQASCYIMRQLTIMPAMSPGNIPKVVNHFIEIAESFVLPARRERSYPRAVRKRPKKYELNTPKKS